ncbi:MAG: hypothetical protein L0Y57_06175 [Beijerinckiaceae bacterium]|nr:hypothetical protein [Beijerinckiaceae bacterium]
MAAFNYSTEAGLFCAKGTNYQQKGLEYRRFARAAEAILFAMEELPSNLLGCCSLEVDEDRYAGNAIRGLYENADFPLPRRRKR